MSLGPDLDTIEHNYVVPPDALDMWKEGLDTYRLVPIPVYSPGDRLLQPKDYVKLLPGAIVEVHFILHFHAVGRDCSFSAIIQQIIIWELGGEGASPLTKRTSLSAGPVRVKHSAKLSAIEMPQKEKVWYHPPDYTDIHSAYRILHMSTIAMSMAMERYVIKPYWEL